MAPGENRGISLVRLWNALPLVVQLYLALFLLLLTATVVVWLCDCFIHHSEDESHHLFPIFANVFTASFGAVIGALSQWATAQFGKEGR